MKWFAKTFLKTRGPSFSFPSPQHTQLEYYPSPDSGVKLIIDIGIIDTTTCEPLENIFVELWSGAEYLNQLVRIRMLIYGYLSQRFRFIQRLRRPRGSTNPSIKHAEQTPRER